MNDFTPLDLINPHGAPPRGSPVTTADVLTLQVGNQVLSGWQRVMVMRSMDSIPANFDLEITEKYPNTPDVTIQPGQPCTVTIGNDLVLTGYVDRYSAAISASSHTVRISGRSKSEDLVDCSAFFGDPDHPSFQMRNTNALAVIQALAAPYNVTIQSMAGPGADVPQLNINVGETAWEIIDRLIRVSGFVAYDMPDGSMMLGQAGTDNMGSGFQLGQNVEQADIAYTMDQRFSDYQGYFLSTVTYGEGGQLTDPAAGPVHHDQGVPRFRKRFVVSEQMGSAQPMADQRAIWECNRRYGRSQQFNVTCDSWRDAAGTLWAPNHLAPIKATQMKLDTDNKPWCIGGVTYTRDENGQHATLILMPVEAFSPEPSVLLPPVLLEQNVTHTNPTKPDTGDLKLPASGQTDLNQRSSSFGGGTGLA